MIDKETVARLARIREQMAARNERYYQLLRMIDSELADAESDLRRGATLDARQALKRVRHAIGIVVK